MLLNRWSPVIVLHGGFPLSDSPRSRRRLSTSLQEQGLARPRVLVVDDDPQVLGAHVRALRSTCVAVAATSASEALSMLEQSQFDVLLTDHDMPGDSCETLLEAAKRLSPDMRRVVVSGADERVLAQAVHRGLAHEYLCKPASAQMLHELVCVV